MNSSPKRVRGSAMTEFALTAAVLTPMLLLIPSLSKTTDMNLTTAQAARYGAWEQTVRPQQGPELVTDISNRFYAASELGIQTKRGALTGEDIQNSYWQGAGPGEQPLFETGNSKLSVQVNHTGLGGIAGGIEKAVHGLGSIADSAVPGANWDIGKNSLYAVSVGVVTNNQRLASINETGSDCVGNEVEGQQCLRFTSAILTDSWGARGPEEVESRVKALVPVGALQPIGDTVAKIGGSLPLFNELDKLDGAFGKVEPDVLPADRYGNEK